MDKYFLNTLMSSNLEMKRVILKELRFKHDIKISKSNLDVESSIEPLMGDIICGLRLKVYGLTKEKCEKYPISWFQYFKEAHFPSWLLKRFPVKYKTLKMKAYKIFPELEVNSQSKCVYEKQEWSNAEV